MEKSVNSSARSPVSAMRSGLCRRTSSRRYRLCASKRLPCRSEICTMRSPENASGSAAQTAVTVLVESVKFSNHAAPASTSAAGSSQRLRPLPRFFSCMRTATSCRSALFYHIPASKKSKTARLRAGNAGLQAKKPRFASRLSIFYIVIFGLECYNIRKKKK